MELTQTVSHLVLDFLFRSRTSFNNAVRAAATGRDADSLLSPRAVLADSTHNESPADNFHGECFEVF